MRRSVLLVLLVVAVGGSAKPDGERSKRAFVSVLSSDDFALAARVLGKSFKS